MDLVFALFAILAFLAVVLTLEGVYNLWANKNSAEAKRLAIRLAMMNGERVEEAQIVRNAVNVPLPWLHQQLVATQNGRNLVAYVASSGKTTTAPELIVLSLGLGVAGLLLPALFGRPLALGAGFGLALAAIPWFNVSRARNARISRFEQQFPDALDLMGRAMRAGHAFPTAVKMAGEEMAEPMGREFRVLSDETTYGVSMSTALQNMAQRVPVPDVGYFVVAVLIQRESGGNMTELLDNISSIIRQRLKLLGEVRTLSAEGRLSAWILCLLPFAVALLVNVVNPKFMEVLWTDPLGIKLVSVAMFMMAIGVFWMRNVVRIRV